MLNVVEPAKAHFAAGDLAVLDNRLAEADRQFSESLRRTEPAEACGTHQPRARQRDEWGTVPPARSTREPQSPGTAVRERLSNKPRRAASPETPIRTLRAGRSSMTPCVASTTRSPPCRLHHRHRHRRQGPSPCRHRQRNQENPLTGRRSCGSTPAPEHRWTGCRKYFAMPQQLRQLMVTRSRTSSTSCRPYGRPLSSEPGFRRCRYHCCGCSGCCLNSFRLCWRRQANSRLLRPAICSFPSRASLRTVCRSSRLGHDLLPLGQPPSDSCVTSNTLRRPKTPSWSTTMLRTVPDCTWSSRVHATLGPESPVRLDALPGEDAGLAARLAGISTPWMHRHFRRRAPGRPRLRGAPKSGQHLAEP